MPTLTASPPVMETVADLLDRLGGISPERIRMTPPPGTATEEDVVAIEEKENRLFELVDGVLVEKVMSFRESFLACGLIHLFKVFVDKKNLGIVVGPDGMMKLAPRLVRMPDVAFISWERLPHRKVPEEPVPHLAPDLAVEVLSKGNTPREMKRKVREYFTAGVRLVWLVEPKNRTVEVYTAPDEATTFEETETIDGGDVLPGFTLPLRRLFAELDRQG